MSSNAITILGIRHHGPGSARSVLKSLDQLEPDLILVEGPSDLSPMLNYLAHEELEPPIALVTYQVDNPGKASYFPFAVFSPEFQAIRFGLKRGLPVKFFDLSQARMMAAGVMPAMPAQDPMVLIAQASGHRHYERWWNALVEERRNPKDVFEAVLELMKALRESELELSTGEDVSFKLDEKIETALKQASPEMAEKLRKELEAKQKASLKLAEQREAHMRQTIRQAQQEGFKKIAIVCGAFHGPALLDIHEKYSETADKEILEAMPEVKVDAAWVPWSYSRLSTSAGYGAGVASPAWYHHLWNQGDEEISATEFASIWLTKVAGFLRTEGFDTSSAHIIETVRLAEALAALREQSYPGLPELMEATQTVMCAGNASPIVLIQKRLIVGERLGFVPADFPMVPLQKDLHRQQQSLNLRPKLEKSHLKLDLRNEQHLKRSHLLHRLRMLEIPWGESLSMRGKAGNFREVWTLEWKPEYAIKVIEASLYGTTVLDAATTYAKEAIQKAQNLDSLSQILDSCLQADLKEVLDDLMQRIHELTANSDVDMMMKALAPLLRVMRYGSLGKTSQVLIEGVVTTLCTRIPIHLPKACVNLRDDLAKERSDLISLTDGLLTALTIHKETWTKALCEIAEHVETHGLIAGKVTRLLLNSRGLSKTQADIYLERHLSYRPSQSQTVEELMKSAFWIEGFFKGSALSLIHDEHLFGRFDAWVLNVPEESFLDILPLLRRTFSSFSLGSRQELQEKAKGLAKPLGQVSRSFDPTQAEQVLPLLAQLLGLKSVEVPSLS